MTAEKHSSGSATIVGGRPMRRAIEVSVQHNVLPKYHLLQQFGFYPKPGRNELVPAEIECCGAHSPDVMI